MKLPNLNLRGLVRSRQAVGFVIRLSKGLPAWLAYPIAYLVARVITLDRKGAMVRAVRANQWMLSGQTLDKKGLDRIVLNTFRTNIISLYDYYHNLDRPEHVRAMVEFDPFFKELIHKAIKGEFSTLLVIPHVSNFDLAGRALAMAGLKFQVLSYPQPPGGYQLANQLREEAGMVISPMSISAVQQARARLKAGGLVLTGLDRPLKDTHYFPRFFGRPSHVPVGYMQLALQASATVCVIACVKVRRGYYKIIARPPITLQPHPDRKTEIITNTEAVLREAEAILRSRPEQWAMFYPVWPEALDEMP